MSSDRLASLYHDLESLDLEILLNLQEARYGLIEKLIDKRGFLLDTIRGVIDICSASQTSVSITTELIKMNEKAMNRQKHMTQMMNDIAREERSERLRTASRVQNNPYVR